MNTLDQKADQQIQVGLIVAGILLTVASTEFSKNWTPVVFFFVYAAIFLFAASAALTAWIKIPRSDIYAATIYPHVLQTWLDYPSDAIKAELVDAMARAYYFNQQILIKRGRVVSIAGYAQIVAMVGAVILIAALAYEAGYNLIVQLPR